jgi:predicted TIM-barrel fold metal-dependent hydrolase
MKIEDMILISLDDHIIEPPNMYDQHLTAEQKQFAPKFQTDKNGNDFWIFDGERLGNIGLNAVVGRPKSEYGMEPLSLSQMREGCYKVDKRIDDMNVNGVLASMPFPQIVQHDGYVFHKYKDKKQALTLLRAYNDWHVDEWCGAAPGRFIPCPLVPTWDMDETVKEVKRLSRKGVHAVTFHDNPANRGLPSPHNEYWDPFWKVCAEHDVVVSMHHGTGNAAPNPSPEAPIDAWIACMSMSISLALADLLHLQALQKYKNLKLALIESGVGWIPYVLERTNFILKQHGSWTGANFGGRSAGEVFQDHFLCTVVHHDGGLSKDAIELLGAHTICYEMDYPHSDCQWPRGPEEAWTFMGALPEAQLDMITHGNAMKAFHFDPFAPMGGRENCTVKALRARAAHVDTSERSLPGDRVSIGTGRGGRVTTSDVFKLFDQIKKDREHGAGAGRY